MSLESGHDYSQQVQQQLHPVEKRSLVANKELPSPLELDLAVNSPEQPITSEMVERWVADLEKFIRRIAQTSNHVLSEYAPVLSNNTFDAHKARDVFERELHYLSREQTIWGLTKFADNILTSFDPASTLFYLPPESVSARLFLENMIALRPELAKFGIALDGYKRLTLERQNAFASADVDTAKAYVYVDDWVLSGEHLNSFLTKDVAGRFHTYHLAVAPSGQQFLERARQHLTPHYLFTVPKESDSGFRVPVFGFHKIPDNIPRYYAKSRKSGYVPEFSVFGKNERGQFLEAHDRLIDHRKLFVPDQSSQTPQTTTP